MKNPGSVRELRQNVTRNYEKYVRAVAKAIRVSRERAREALHRAILRMLAGPGGRPRGRRVLDWKPYIVRSGINALLDERKERRRDLRLSDLYEDEREKLWEIPDPGPAPGWWGEGSETAAVLWSEVKCLSRREAEVVKRWAHGSSYRDIAKSLRIRPSTVRELCSRGIRHLRNAPRIRELAA